MADALPQRAMVLAAGLGRRMRAAPDDPPKPLTQIGGESLLARILARLEAAGVTQIIVNVHHKPEQIEAYLAARKSHATITISDERAQLLETGGGVVKALPLLGDAPFFVCNADILWRESAPNLSAMAARYAALPASSALLLLARRDAASGYDGAGDFTMAADGRLMRGADFIFAGVQILSPQLFAGLAAEPFSLNRIYDTALAAGGLFGHELQGRWMHVGTPEGVAAAEAVLAQARA